MSRQFVASTNKIKRSRLLDRYEQNKDIHNKKSRISFREDDEIDIISNELHVIQMNTKDESLYVISLDRK